MKKLIVVLGMAGVVIAQPLFAATITGDCPILTIPAYSITLGVIGDDLYDQFMIALNDANAELAKYDDQDKLATGFANANMYSTNAATQQGYPNYSLFAITTGVMVGAQAPTINIGSRCLSANHNAGGYGKQAIVGIALLRGGIG